jgi:hypothetical protein
VSGAGFWGWFLGFAPGGWPARGCILQGVSRVGFPDGGMAVMLEAQKRAPEASPRNVFQKRSSEISPRNDFPARGPPIPEGVESTFLKRRA